MHLAASIEHIEMQSAGQRGIRLIYFWHTHTHKQRTRVYVAWHMGIIVIMAHPKTTDKLNANDNEKCCSSLITKILIKIKWS